jgi:hypothetical protein
MTLSSQHDGCEQSGDNAKQPARSATVPNALMRHKPAAVPGAATRVPNLKAWRSAHTSQNLYTERFTLSGMAVSPLSIVPWDPSSLSTPPDQSPQLWPIMPRRGS